MGKLLSLPIDKYQIDSITRAMRSKGDVISVWIETIKAFLVNQPAQNGDVVGEICIVVESMSRIFCTLNDGRKIFSLAFPFIVTATDEGLNFRSREGININSRNSSLILELIEGAAVLGATDFGTFVDPIIDVVDHSPEVWSLLRELMLAEDSYLRYDFDSDRENGHLHPLHHIDFSYTNYATFKIGLSAQVDRDGLVRILDIGTDCLYLQSAAN